MPTHFTAGKPMSGLVNEDLISKALHFLRMRWQAPVAYQILVNTIYLLGLVELGNR